MIENEKLKMKISNRGYVSELVIKDDAYKMNWVMDDGYLKEAGYKEQDKLFGEFDIIADGTKISSNETIPQIKKGDAKADIKYNFEKLSVEFIYDLQKRKDGLCWEVRVTNNTNEEISIDEFGIWISFAYVMFRDKNVEKNIHNSAAVFTSVSKNYTKLSIARRDGTSESLGMYQTVGETKSIGTYCAYRNLFFENVSPSLDGMLFHKLYLSGGYEKNFQNHDWIYEKNGFALGANEIKTWEYVINTNKTKDEFYENGLLLRHPFIEYTPLNIIGETVRGRIKLPDGLKLLKVRAEYQSDNKVVNGEVTVNEETNGSYGFSFRPQHMGEHKIVFTFTNGTEDFTVLNVMDRLDKVIEERVQYICNELYTGEDGNPACAFAPVSNQGESLGKANLVLKKNLLGTLDVTQVQKVEKCAVNYVRPKWFYQGDFRKPEKLYGDFYRCMDFEYIAHLFYLLSEF